MHRSGGVGQIPPSLPSRGAWIEIIIRSSCGEGTDESLPSRGAWIEIIFVATALATIASLPSRGAWIEIRKPWTLFLEKMSLPSRGAWIEISRSLWPPALPRGRSPHGERGLK